MDSVFQDEFLEIVDSTNLRARVLADDGVVSGSGVVARQQSAGRGRLQRRWYSANNDNLYCSYILEPNLPLEQFPLLTMLAGLAVAEMIDEWLPGTVGLKWPNDIIIGGRKCGGILCETYQPWGEQRLPVVIAGIGINLNMTQADIPPELGAIATSLVIEGSPPRQAGEVFTRLRDYLLTRLEVFEAKGFAPILENWCRFDILRGKKTSWVSSEGVCVTGVSLGPGTDGLLRIRDDHGDIHQVISGDLSLVSRD